MIFFILVFTKVLVTAGFNLKENIDSTEVVDLSTGCSMFLSNYPKKLAETTGQFLDDKVIICGGENPANSECFALQRQTHSFEFFTYMKDTRRTAKSIVTQGHIWVTGGLGGKYGEDYRLSSTEYIPRSSNYEPSLPETVWMHAIVSINSTISMLIGGIRKTFSNVHDDFSPKTHYFDHQRQTWKDGPSLIDGRNGHTAGVIMDHVTHKQHIAVVGGTNIGGNCHLVELLFHGETQWQNGIQYFSSYNA